MMYWQAESSSVKLFCFSERKIFYQKYPLYNSAMAGTREMFETQTVIGVQPRAHILSTQVHQMLQLQKGRSLQ